MYSFGIMKKNQFILSDEDLWVRFVSGEDKCIEIIYKRYVDVLYSYGLKIINDESLVFDCIQDVFVKLIERKKDLNVGSRIRIYVIKSLRNRLVDELRSSLRKRDILNNPSIEFESKRTESPENELIEIEEKSSIQKEIQKAIDDLPGKQKEIVFLKYTEGLSYDEIATILEIDKASARTLLYRTLKSLKQTLFNQAIILFLLITSHFIKREIGKNLKK